MTDGRPFGASDGTRAPDHLHQVSRRVGL